MDADHSETNPIDTSALEASLSRLISEWWTKTSLANFASEEVDQCEILKLKGDAKALISARPFD